MNSPISLETHHQQSLLEKRLKSFLENPAIQFISFDIFDTLFFRNCNLPINLFMRVGHHDDVRARFDTPETFQQYRIVAERRAREKNHGEEVFLSQIYEELPLEKETAKRIMTLELFEEKQSLFINPYLFRWIQMAKSAGKKVILISDTYFNTAQIHELILSKFHDTTLINKIFLSCEIQKTKATASSFHHVLKVLSIPPEAMVHIGDHPINDDHVPRQIGIHTIPFIPGLSAHDRFALETHYLKQDFGKYQYLRLISVCQNPYESERETFFFELGSSIGGMILWDFCHWVIRNARLSQTQQVALIMREGQIFNHCMRLLENYHDLDLRLVYASRKSTYFPSLSNSSDRHGHHFYRYRDFSIGDLYSSFHLNIINPEIRLYADTPFHNACTIINESGKNLSDTIAHDLEMRRSEIAHATEEQKQCFLSYLESLNIQPNALWIDFGGSGSIFTQIEQTTQNDKLKSALFFIHEEAFAKNLHRGTSSFLPLNDQTRPAIELIRRSCDLIETLFNGLNHTTLQYDCTDTDPKPITAISTIPQTHQDALNAFVRGIDLFFTAAITYKVDGPAFNPDLLAKSLGRLIETPTAAEAKWLGELFYDDGVQGAFATKLLTPEKIEYTKTVGIEQLYYDLCQNPSSHKDKLAWPYGAIAMIDSSYLPTILKLSGKSTNQHVIDHLLIQLRHSKIKNLSVYGAGEFFVQIVPYLKDLGITINYVVDSRAKTGPVEILNFLAISPEEAIINGERAFVIASGAFVRQMEEHLLHLSQKYSVSLSIFSIRDIVQT